MRIFCECLCLPGGEVATGSFMVLVKDGEIAEVKVLDGHSGSQDGSEEEDLHTYLLTPGFIDLHTHGMGGADEVIDFWLHPEHTQKVFPRQGTTSFLASVVFPKSHPDKTAAVLSCLAGSVGRVKDGMAVLEGIHAEGPIVNDLGAMPSSDATMCLAEFKSMLDSMPHLKVMTISPHLEAPEDYQRIKVLLKRGVVPAMGHDRVASEGEILGALSCCPEGKRLHITHLFNVSSFHHRNPSLVNFGLCDRLPQQPQYEGLSPPTIELVGDMVHVHPMVVSTTLKARNYKDVIFVSDSILEPKCGTVVGYSDRKVEVSEDCKSVSLVGENVLAGSCCSLLNTFHSLVRVLDVPVGQAVCMLAENPARIASLHHTGTIAVGKRADLLLFDKNLELRRTIIAGRTAHCQL